jgi:phospholipid N-methyltransferase
MPLAAFCKSIKCKHMGHNEVHSNHVGDYGPGTGLMTQTICKLTGKTPRQTKDSECKKEIG